MHGLSVLEEELSSADGDPSAAALLQAIARWRRGDEDAEVLFDLGRGTLRHHDCASSLVQRWDALESTLRAATALMTPHELCRSYGLLEAYLALRSEQRQRMVSRLRLATERPIPDTRTPAERERQALERLRFEQQFFQDQGDPVLRDIQARARARPPRRMLPPAMLAQSQAELSLQRIDLTVEASLSLIARDADHAVRLACLLSRTRGCDLFRGQPADWNPMPTLYRDGPGCEAEKAQRLVRFREWASGQPLLQPFCADKSIEAIAQHYGIPTSLLDFTENPRIAAFFATDTDLPADDRMACLFCLNSGSLDGFSHSAMSWQRYYEVVPLVIRLRVHELYRMEAQEGSFVFVHQRDWAGFRMDVIRFPRTGRVAAPSREDIYPDDKSELECTVEGYFTKAGP